MSRFTVCDAEGRCVQKNVPFEMRNCQSYQCVPTQNGGYNFQPLGYRSKHECSYYTDTHRLILGLNCLLRFFVFIFVTGL